MKLPSLLQIVVAEVAVWAVLCMLVHGPAILAYIALQVATSGVFAFAVERSYRRHLQSAKARPVVTPIPEATPQPAETVAAQAG